MDDGTCLGVGCPDPAASNFDPLAQIFGLGDFSLCEYPKPVPGCTDPYAPNYNPLANTDDGSCEAYELAGCTDPAAINFNPLLIFFYGVNGWDENTVSLASLPHAIQQPIAPLP
ncbi:MAG: hypothetical protein CL822_03165, partial [Crocinitomicaceae bacterium]|nr:hypothetical protein [Crocinitomicaceae bacterium]